MRSFAALIYILCTCSPLIAGIDTNRILFLLHRGELDDAIDLYRASIEDSHHDHEAIESICQIIMEQGFRNSDPEIQMMTIFGAGIAANEKALYIIEDAVKSPVPPIQLAALNLLARSQHDGIDEHLRYALRSPYLLLRLEALYLLAEEKNPKTASYAESLMAIVNEELLPIFPDIFAEAGDGASTKMLKKMISHPRENVRIATVLALAKHKRDDFLPKIRILASHHSPKQLEVCAYALGVLKDESSIPRLQQLTNLSHPNVKLAALTALSRLGRKEAQQPIEEMALNEDLFAIAALEHVSGSEETLAKLIKSSNPNVRINATLGLLAKQDLRCLPGVGEILLRDSRDYAFTRISSQGHSATAWRVVPSSQQQLEEGPGLNDLSQALKNMVLVKALELDEKVFLQVANAILASGQNELVPSLMPLLENKQTSGSIELLKKYQQKVGAPLVRQYCCLSLYNLKEPGPYETLIKDWIAGHMHESLFRFKPSADLNVREFGPSFNLTPDETSKLLIGSIEALARAQNDLSIDILLEIIKNGHPSNKYALAGLLMRVAQ